MCSRPLVVVCMVMALTVANPVPLETTTARYSLGGYTQTFLPQFSDLISISRQSKSPKNDNFYYESLIRDLLSPQSFHINDAQARKLRKKNKITYSSQLVRNKNENLPNNKTIKFNTVTTLNTQNSLNTSTPLPKTTTINNPTNNNKIVINLTNKPITFETKVPFVTPPGITKTPPAISISATKAPLITNSLKLVNATNKAPAFPVRVYSYKLTTPKPITTTTSRPLVTVKTITRNFTNSLQTTKGPFRIKLSPIRTTTTTTRPQTKIWPATNIKTKNDLDRYRNYTQIPTTQTPSSSLKLKPTVRRVVTKWSDRPSLTEIKQNWYEEGVPYPNPQPEISSSSPPFSISDISSISPQSEQNPLLNPISELNNAISTFNLDLAPALAPATDTKDAGDLTTGGAGCPTVHISSSVLTPQQRQSCSDLNLVINSHFHQNTATERTPTPSSYDAGPGTGEAADAIGQPLADFPAEGLPLADAPGGGIGAPLADAPAAAAPAAGGPGGSGGTGGNGGNGGDGDGGGWKFPDLKGLFDALGYIWGGLKHILRFLANPYLYIIPIALSFLLGFILKLALFPWWIPALFLYIGTKGTQKSNIAYYKHVHKPVHHHDGWFWNHDTKTWQNIADYYHHHHRRNDENEDTSITKAINDFAQKYRRANNTNLTWKWRRRNR